MGAGGAPRFMIGTVNAVEFFVTTAISAAFLTALLTGHWEQADGVTQYLWSVAGLIVGGLAAAPLAGFVVRLIPQQWLMFMVSALVLLVCAYQVWILLT